MNVGDIEGILLFFVWISAGFILMITYFTIGNLLENIETIAENSIEIKSLLKQTDGNQTGADNNRTQNS